MLSPSQSLHRLLADDRKKNERILQHWLIHHQSAACFTLSQQKINSTECFTRPPHTGNQGPFRPWSLAKRDIVYGWWERKKAQHSFIPTPVLLTCDFWFACWKNSFQTAAPRWVVDDDLILFGAAEASLRSLASQSNLAGSREVLLEFLNNQSTSMTVLKSGEKVGNNKKKQQSFECSHILTREARVSARPENMVRSHHSNFSKERFSSSVAEVRCRALMKAKWKSLPNHLPTTTTTATIISERGGRKGSEWSSASVFECTEHHISVLQLVLQWCALRCCSNVVRLARKKKKLDFFPFFLIDFLCLCWPTSTEDPLRFDRNDTGKLWQSVATTCIQAPQQPLKLILQITVILY